MAQFSVVKEGTWEFSISDLDSMIAEVEAGRYVAWRFTRMRTKSAAGNVYELWAPEWSVADSPEELNRKLGTSLSLFGPVEDPETDYDLRINGTPWTVMSLVGNRIGNGAAFMADVHTLCAVEDDGSEKYQSFDAS